MERQALRRRKVEALESLAHTAALFLAEFMDFKKTSSSTANGTGGGGAYAAAAAGIAANLFQPPTGEEGDAWVGHQHDGAGEERSGRLSDSENSANGSDDDDDQDIPARFPQGEADGEEYDSEETPSEALEDFNMGPGAGQEEPDVKVEDD
ncbi:hypothetical protein VM1G_11496 [Cytospora mali]|uniref:Uncharacterized protein n=1 Tax=Cytospora mali TaxID=578113 RepID=A0A194VU59_CYTMA|nr:hypothetical protein VM1G_11496 [Valsa mali]